MQINQLVFPQVKGKRLIRISLSQESQKKTQHHSLIKEKTPFEILLLK